MEQSKMFGEAKWVCAGDYGEHTSETLHPAGLPHFPILRSAFECERQGLQKAVLRVLGLGFFHCYVNGKEITQDQFLPLNTDYEPRADYPIHETLAGHRIYVPEYDVTDFLNEGKMSLPSTSAAAGIPSTAMTDGCRGMIPASAARRPFSGSCWKARRESGRSSPPAGTGWGTVL